MKRIFDYLDTDRDKFLNYIEFSKLNRNSQITSRLPENKMLTSNFSVTNYKLNPRAKSNDFNDLQAIEGKVLH